MLDLLKNGSSRSLATNIPPVQPAIVAGCDSFKRLAVNGPEILACQHVTDSLP
jgi:hypothetical protein